MLASPETSAPTKEAKEKGNGERQAYFTLVANDAFVVGACVLGYSLKLAEAEAIKEEREGVKSGGTNKKQRIVMVTEGVGKAGRQRLRRAGWQVMEVDPLPNPNKHATVKAWNDVGFTKV